MSQYVYIRGSIIEVLQFHEHFRRIDALHQILLVLDVAVFVKRCFLFHLVRG